MKEYNKLLIDYAKILGEFKGTLEAVTYWDVPQELKDKMNSKISELEKIEVKSTLAPVSKRSCLKACSPSDWYEGGKCDKNGCYHK